MRGLTKPLTNMSEEVRYFGEETQLSAGAEAIRVCFCRSCAISGFIIDREAAAAAATEEFDGNAVLPDAPHSCGVM